MRKQFNRQNQYVISFTEYVATLHSDSADTLSSEEFRCSLKARLSKLRVMEKELSKDTLRLGLSIAEVERVAIRCGLDCDLAATIAAEFTKQPLTLHRLAG